MQDIYKAFVDAGAIKKGHFIRKSGRHTDCFVQCSHLFENCELGEAVCASLAGKLKDIQADIVLGAAIGGVLPAFLVAKELKKPNIFCERKDGALLLSRGFRILEGSSVLIVEDEVTTGSSVREMIEMVYALGARPVAVACFVDKSNQTLDFGIPFISLIKQEVSAFKQEDCPLCKENIPLDMIG